VTIRWAALIAIAMVGCAGRPPRGPEPPAPLPEIQTSAPAPGMVWVAGAWEHDGTDWVWVPGRWESPPTR
jgi:hypothetical protein